MRSSAPLAIVTALSVLFVCGTVRADSTKDAAEPDRPNSLTIRIGDVAARIDGPKLWTLSRIDYQSNIMAIEDSAYGTVFTIRDVGSLARIIHTPQMG